MSENEGARPSERAARRVSRDHGVEEFHAISPAQHVVVDVACLSAIGLVVSEPAARLALGVGARESFALHDLVDAALEVEPELVVDLAIRAPAAAGKSKDALHRAAPTAVPRASSTRPTTPVYRVHRSCSAARCFRPAAVRR